MTIHQRIGYHTYLDCWKAKFHHEIARSRRVDVSYFIFYPLFILIHKGLISPPSIRPCVKQLDAVSWGSLIDSVLSHGKTRSFVLCYSARQLGQDFIYYRLRRDHKNWGVTTKFHLKPGDNNYSRFTSGWGLGQIGAVNPAEADSAVGERHHDHISVKPSLTNIHKTAEQNNRVRVAGLALFSA